MKKYSFHWAGIIFALWIMLLIFIASIVPRYLPQTLFVGSRNNFDERLPRWLYDNPLPKWIWMWANLDGGHYVSIARDGYYKNEHGFFPFYPLMIRFVHSVTSAPFIICGLLISYLSLFGFIKLFMNLFRNDHVRTNPYWLQWWMMTFPAVFFLISVYNDSFYLFLTMLVFHFVGKKKWWLARIAAYAVGLTRITSLALFPALLIEGWRSKKNRTELWTAAVCAPLGVLSYLGYLERFEGGWHVFFDSMAIWGQNKFVFPIQTFWRYTKILATYHHFDQIFFVSLIELSLILFAAYLLIVGKKMIRESLWAYSLAVTILPSTSGTGSGFPRYFIHAFPLIMILAIAFRKKRFLTIVIGLVFLFIQLVSFSFFSQGYFVS